MNKKSSLKTIYALVAICAIVFSCFNFSSAVDVKAETKENQAGQSVEIINNQQMSSESDSSTNTEMQNTTASNAKTATPMVETLYVKVSSLAVRPAKNSTVLLGTLTRGTKITGYREGAWIRITYNGKTAYIAAKFTDTKPIAETLYYIKSRSLAVRPAKNSTVLLGTLTRGTKVTGYREGAWIRIIYNGKTAYIAAKFTDTTPVSETLYVKVSSLAVRPAKNSTILLGTLTRGTKVTGYREGAWIRITYNGKTAYIAAKFTDTKPIAETLYYIKSRSLAVRPAKNSTVLLGTLTRGTKVTGYREGAWIRIIYNGKTAYIAAKFTDTTPVSETLYVKASSLAVRPAKNSKELLGILRKGTRISGYRDGAWFRITYNGKTAYVAVAHLQTDPVDNAWTFSKFSYRNATLYVYDSSGSIISRRYVGGNHILISLGHQYMWVFNNNNLVMSTPIISGKPSTPTVVGNFYVTYKQRNTNLIGPTWNEAVNYWAPFYNGYGIHDASWQPTSGFYMNSNTYRYRGSHGCVNVPPKNMPAVFNNISAGTPVTVVR